MHYKVRHCFNMNFKRESNELMCVCVCVVKGYRNRCVIVSEANHNT